MATIGVTELKQRLSEILSEVERTGEPVSVTRRGRTVAELRRVRTKPTEEEIDAYLAGWDDLRNSVVGIWPEGVTGLDAVLEQRRELRSSSTSLSRPLAIARRRQGSRWPPPRLSA